MKISSHCRRAIWAVLLSAAVTLDGSPAAAQDSERYQGRSLVEALQKLQARGLRIVFTSATVTPDLQVRIEPRGVTAREQLDELLTPHGLKSRDGPGGTIQIVRAERVLTPAPTPAAMIAGIVVHGFSRAPLEGVVVRVDGTIAEGRTDASGRFVLPGVAPGTRIVRASAVGYAVATRTLQLTRGATIDLTLSLMPSASVLTEQVTVNRPRPWRKDRGVASETTVERAEWEMLDGSAGTAGDDLMRAVHAFPRVSLVDEFRGEFTVRGSPFRHVDFVVDGVSAHWLQHTAHGRGATGSLAMLGATVLEDATLRAGAYPHRYGDRIGPQLDLTVREGSREKFSVRAAIGTTNAMTLGEGPLGLTGRGSWLVAMRHSYVAWPNKSAGSSRTPFGFSDGLAKLVYDVRPNQQIAFTTLGGISNVDGEEDNLVPTELGDGTNHASVVNLSWRSTFGSAVVLNQRASVVRRGFVNRYQTGRQSDRGANEEITYRADIARPIGNGLFEAGAQVVRSGIDDVPRSPETDGGYTGSSWGRSGYVHFAWAALPALRLSPGLRVTSSTLTPHPTIARWLLGEWSFRSEWIFSVSSGVSYQLPDLDHVFGRAGSAELAPERATHFDVAIEHRLTDSIRWQATLFNRKEDDILREPDLHPRLVGDRIAVPEAGRYANALQGSSRGIELLVDRSRPGATGLSGWAAYSYGKTRYTDTERHETFFGDFDQRHLFNLVGVYRFSTRVGVGATFRAGSNFPVPGYFASRDGGLFLADHRNRVRLPASARLDVRGDREFEYFGRRLRLVVEVLNVLNRRNVGRASGFVNPSTGEATGFTEAVSRRRASAGIVIEF